MNKYKKSLVLNFSERNLQNFLYLLRNPNLESGIAYHLVNSFTLVLAAESENLRAILEKNILICDGKPLSFVLQKNGLAIEQIRGVDLMRNALIDTESNARHFFLGSTEKVLTSLIIQAKTLNPNILIVGQHAPDFANDFSEELPGWIEMLRRSKASIVWIGLGTPKQDFVVDHIAKSVPVHAIAVGAAFDFLSGNVKEAPKIFRVSGLEWLFRLILEPRRLAGRYIIGNYKFIKLILRSKWSVD